MGALLLNENESAARSNVARAARLHWLDDDAVIKFFQQFVSKTPLELRELLDDPMFNAGFVAGLSYVRTQVPASEGETIKRGDISILERVIHSVIEATKHTPFISKN